MTGAFPSPLAISALVHIAAVVAIVVRVIMLRPAPGIAFAWLFLVAALPVFGVVAYLIVGERRVGARRARGFQRFRHDESRRARERLWQGAAAEWSGHRSAAAALDRLGRTLTGNPTLGGNLMQLHRDNLDILRLIGDDFHGRKRDMQKVT